MKAVRFTDDELVSAIRDKDRANEAISYIYQSYFETLSSLIVHNSGSRQDSEDVIQEVMVTFVHIIREGKFRGESSIKTFLMSLTRNFWLNSLRTKERLTARNMAFEKGREQEEESVMELIAERERKAQMLQLLEKTGEMCKKILLLFYYKEMPVKEMLQHLPYENEQVIRNKKSKCLKALSEQIKTQPGLSQVLERTQKDPQDENR